MILLHLATFAFWALTGFAAVNALCTTFTLVALFRHRSETSDDADLPRVAVLLCLRGADPNLAGGLRRLMKQQYPNYEVFIVIDSETDPAWGIVKQTIDDAQRRDSSRSVSESEPTTADSRQGEAGPTSTLSQVHVSSLRQRLETCSLKCSSLVQLLDQIDDSFQVVVLADSDLESHPTWLRELVAPLADPRVGAAFGNRWFLPARGWMGSLVRQVCNAIGVVTMHLGQIPWGGSLAIRASVLKQSGLRQTLTRSIVDDGPVRVALKEQGLKLRFVPSLLMANREDCDLRFAHSFLTRQLKWTQTYMSSQWPVMLVYTLGVLGTYMAALVLAVVCLLLGLHVEASWFAAGAAVYSGTVMTLWFLLDLAARRIIRAQGEPAPRILGVQLLKIPAAMLLAVLVHVSAMICATFLKRVIWRGVTYEVHGPSEVQLLSDGVMKTSLEPANVSL
ncbi:glycosyltransferase family 2 protein [Rhodopirellula sp. P2]|uniref:glycosyltransferase family 2 protein n=1 Tax=Rhodopirellula sp. P2 TaxID=2127060 RepID=UPI002368B646|nr:glycosyltransferase family 2 protein [Rhodopirellula sp. P2]WDQ17784.1 glycosyltransferase family 2 protein [Rhodopirellula sp. P2]